MPDTSLSLLHKARDEFLQGLDDPAMAAYGVINFGPWDRIDGNSPFVAGVGEKPAGAQFYPEDVTVEEFDAAVAASDDGGEALKSLYTMVRRDEDGDLVAVPYSEAFSGPMNRAAELLEAAAEHAEDEGVGRADAAQNAARCAAGANCGVPATSLITILAL